MQIFTACKTVSYNAVHSVLPSISSVINEQEVTSNITEDVFLTHYLEKEKYYTKLD